MIVSLRKSLLLACLLGLQLGLFAQVDQRGKVVHAGNQTMANQEATVSLSFYNSPLSDVLSFYEGLTGLKIIRDGATDEVRVAIVSGKELKKETAIQLIEKSLLFKGYVFVPTQVEKVKRLDPSQTSISKTLSDNEKAPLPAHGSTTESSGRVVLSFPDTMIAQLLILYEDLTGHLIIRDAEVGENTLSVVAEKELTRAEAITLIEKSFSSNGYSFVPAGDGMILLLNENKDLPTKATQQFSSDKKAVDLSTPSRRLLIPTPQPPQQ